MNEEYLTMDLEWDSEVGEVDESEFQPITEVGTMQYLGSKEVTAFASGSTLTLPDVIINGQPWSRGGLREGHTSKDQKGEYERNTTAHFILYELTNRNGEDYSMVEVLYTMTTIPVEKDNLDRYPFITLNERQQKALDEKGVAWLSHWSNFQFPALRNSLPPAVRDKLSKGEKIHYKATVGLAGKGKTGTDRDGNAKTFYDKYRHSFEVFNTRDEMLNARSQNGVSGGKTGVFYPASWTRTHNGVQDVINYWRPKCEALSDDELAKALGLASELKDDGTAMTEDDIKQVILAVRGTAF